MRSEIDDPDSRAEFQGGFSRRVYPEPARRGNATWSGCTLVLYLPRIGPFDTNSIQFKTKRPHGGFGVYIKVDATVTS